MLHRWLHPVRGAVVVPELADEVVTPAYDALDEADRDELRRGSRWTFLHALPATSRPGAVTDVELDRCAAAVERLHDGAFADRPAPFVAVYRLREGDHAQTGLIADLDTSALGEVVRGHELTMKEREDDLVAYLDRVRVQSSPVCLAAPDGTGLVAGLDALTSRPADVTVTGPDLLQELWVVDDPAEVRDVLASTAEVERAVITDGHHRAAAATRNAAGRVLVALFPAGQLQVSGFHRVVRPPLPAEPGAIADVLASAGFEVAATSGTAPEPGRALLRTTTGRWLVGLDPVAGPGPDVRRLQDQVLGPVFGIDDPRLDARLLHLPTSVPTTRLGEAIGPDGVALTTVAPDADDLLAAARDDRTLPPKSTYVRPKARSGLLLVPR